MKIADAILAGTTTHRHDVGVCTPHFAASSNPVQTLALPHNDTLSDKIATATRRATWDSCTREALAKATPSGWTCLKSVHWASSTTRHETASLAQLTSDHNNYFSSFQSVHTPMQTRPGLMRAMPMIAMRGRPFLEPNPLLRNGSLTCLLYTPSAR